MIPMIVVLVVLLMILLGMPMEVFTQKKSFKKMINEIHEKEIHQTQEKAITPVDRLLKYSQKYYKRFKRYDKKGDYEKFSKLLDVSGLAQTITPEGVLAGRFVFAILFGGFLVLMGVLSQNPGLYVLALVFAWGGHKYPEFYLKDKMKKRQIQIERDIPSVLNTMAIMTEAGLGLFEAIDKVCEVKQGEFVKELRQVSEDVKLGTLRKEAFVKMADRCEVVQVTTFVSALVQVLEKGAGGISIFIKEQAEEIWTKRLNKAKELGAKASLKLFFPMMFLVMPAAMIFVVGPVLISIIKSLL